MAPLMLQASELRMANCRSSRSTKRSRTVLPRKRAWQLLEGLGFRIEGSRLAVRGPTLIEKPYNTLKELNNKNLY